jgi:glutamine amidotransferase
VNLERIAPKTQSRLIFAHVRATTEGSLAENNCHPFQHNTLMWMHNGNVGAWKYVKRRISNSLAERWYLGIKGGTDSEYAFALFLDTLEKEFGVDPSTEPETGFGPKILRRAMERTIQKINEFVKSVPVEHHLDEVETRSLLNFAVTDGHSVVVTRYVSSKTDAAASLYYSSGTAWVEGKEKGDFRMERGDKASDVVLVASEPLTFERHNWLAVPTNTIVTISRQTVFVEPIMDEYFDEDPSRERSSGFAKSKGLVAKAPGDMSVAPTPTAVTPPASPGPEIEVPMITTNGKAVLVNGH